MVSRRAEIRLRLLVMKVPKPFRRFRGRKRHGDSASERAPLRRAGTVGKPETGMVVFKGSNTSSGYDVARATRGAGGKVTQAFNAMVND
jgi:hypothetical protein